jgi:hypothetical protein
MKAMKYTFYKQFTRYNENYTSTERKYLRERCDPNRIYDAKPIEMEPIKAVRIG